MNKKQFQTIDEYIETFPPEIQLILEKIRHTVKMVAPEATETISYRMPAFKHRGRNLIFFAAFKEHIGLYPLPKSIETFKNELAPYKQGKGSVQFPINKPIPYDIIKKIVLFRLNKNPDISKSGFR
jgi:uncharacterized protein YdhG (YjbR/CyaY superfamily)